MTREELKDWMDDGSKVRVANVTFEKKDGELIFDKEEEIVDLVLANLGPIEKVQKESSLFRLTSCV